MTHKAKRLVRLALITVSVASLYALFADSALAQCVMCRASLGANGSFVRNLNIGVVVLLVPPVSIFCAIFFIALRQRK